MTDQLPTATRPTNEAASVDRLPYLPAIDGLRTLALAVVLLDHGGVVAVRGGHLGVTVFFVLSGFLVTGLLLQERQRAGRIHLRSFWARRARRLVPASLLFVGFTLAYLAWSPARPPSTVLGDGIASLTWSVNWRFVLTERSYADLFTDPTPFAHLWSLAVEEQLYLVLPVVVSVLLGRRRSASAGRALLGVVLVGVIAGSTFLAWQLYGPEQDSTRAYYGTDTRVAELAVGALLAVVLVQARGLVALTARWRAAASVAAVASLVGIGWLVLHVAVEDAFNYHGGLLLVALLGATVVVACTQPDAAVARVLAVSPLPQLGRLTYGAYLFHWPIFLWCDESTTGVEGPALLALRVALTFGAAALSYVLVEQPFRLRQLPRIVGGMAWANVSVGLVAALAVVVATTVPSSASLVAASGDEPPPVPVAPGAGAAVAPSAGAQPDAPVSTAAPTTVAPTAATAPANAGDPAAAAPATTPTPAPTPAPTTPPPSGAEQPRGSAPPPTTAPPTGALRVAVVGDSLANDLGNGLLAWAEGRQDVVVYNLSIRACPISRGGTRRFPDGSDFPVREQCGWWANPADERHQNLLTFDPDIVLVEDALNEIVDRKLPEWEDYRHVGDPRFDTWLLSEYRAAAEVFSSQGATVVYADAPCAAWDRVERWRSIEDPDVRVAALNRVYDSVVAATTRVAGLHERLCPGGGYSDEVEGVAEGRPDGFHLSDEASRRLAERWTAPFLREVAATRGG